MDFELTLFLGVFIFLRSWYFRLHFVIKLLYKATQPSWNLKLLKLKNKLHYFLKKKKKTLLLAYFK
jgi:hypothetical protein